MLTGFINVLKPPGCTSHDVVQRLRKLLNTRRIGHGGTLDPLAVGVLPIAVGSATRLLEYLQEMDKSYRAEYILGLETDTQDLAGKILSANGCSALSAKYLSATAEHFTGGLKQIPPMTSAIHYKGRRLYELARLGKKVERPERQIYIKKFDIIKHWLDKPYLRVLADINCSKGTYIRTLGADWGRYIGCGATLAFLIRTRVGSFKLKGSWTLEELVAQVAAGSKQYLLPPTAGLLHMKAAEIKKTAVKAVINGMAIKAVDCTYIPQVKQGETIGLEEKGRLLALARVIINKNGLLLLKPNKVFK